ncbi:hypothetical protein EWM64_g103 [Hericium alpestre]|uniref:Uncharacterized protein n=1 Tax=Hericium alpestre TaxID=135208 RepID=A0A4Z0ABD7_9AGAM|nr:hypothetical protein EWM64_g103 [Hericium alpestre]
MSGPTSFKSLRLSQVDYDRHMQSQSSYAQDTLKCDENAPELKITAESEEAKEVLRESSGVEDQDWILVPYDPRDSTELIMQRVEGVIRIPQKHWKLAGNGRVFRSHKDLAFLGYFGRSQTESINAILLPKSDVNGYIAANRMTKDWMRFPHKPSAASELPVNPHARAQALFPLLDTADSPHWAEYIAHRQAAEACIDDAFEELECDENVENAAYRKMIRAATLKSLCGENDLKEEERKKIADAVVNVSLWTNHGGFEMRDVYVITRIHSLVAPKSVDMHLTYHYRTRLSSVEYYYTLGFRINATPVPPLEDIPRRSNEVVFVHTGQGWRTFGWFCLGHRRTEHSACLVSRFDLQEVHDALFGPVETGKLGERVSLRGTAKLMLASVGFEFDIALDEEDKAKNGDGHTVNDGARLCLSARKPGISAAYLRTICGIPPLEDDDAEWHSQVATRTSDDEYGYGSDDDGYGHGSQDGECIVA